MSTPTVHTFYKSNTPTRMVEAQAQVFAHLGIPLKQWKDDSATHCEWINTIMRDDSLGPLAIIADIDAFPLSRAGFDKLVAQAEAGAVAGLAQVANHKDPSRSTLHQCFWLCSAASIPNWARHPCAGPKQATLPKSSQTVRRRLALKWP